MFYNLPIELQNYINQYDTDFLTIKILIFKEIVNTKMYNLKNELIKYNQFLNNIENIKKYTCYLEKNIVSNCFINQKKRKQFEISPKVTLHFDNLKRNIEYYNDIDSKCFKKLRSLCKHNTIITQSDYDYHKPRYTYTCKLCKMNV